LGRARRRTLGRRQQHRVTVQHRPGDPDARRLDRRAVKPAGGTVAYADVVTHLIGSQVTSTDLETALRNLIPQAGAAFDWLNSVLGSSQGQLLQTLFQTLAVPSAQQATTLINQLGAEQAVDQALVTGLLNIAASKGWAYGTDLNTALTYPSDAGAAVSQDAGSF